MKGLSSNSFTGAFPGVTKWFSLAYSNHWGIQVSP